MLRVDRAECRETGLDELISVANIDFEFDFLKLHFYSITYKFTQNNTHHSNI